MENTLIALEVMGLGMLAIFAVILVIIGIVSVLTRLSRTPSSKEDGRDAPPGA